MLIPKLFYSNVITVYNTVLFVSYFQAYSYSDGQVFEKSITDNDDEQYTPLWFVMDEFGSCIKHSDDPSFAVAIIHYEPLQVTFSVLWPLKDMDYGGLFLIEIAVFGPLGIWERGTLKYLELVCMKNQTIFSVITCRVMRCNDMSLYSFLLKYSPDLFSCQLRRVNICIF